MKCQISFYLNEREMAMSSKINLNQVLNHKHQDLFQSTDFELCVRGGTHAGKTYSLADKNLMQAILQPNIPIKTLCLRKTFPSLRNSMIDVLKKRAEKLKLPLHINENKWIGRCLNIEFIFLSLNNKEDYQKMMSITDVDFAWVNEIPDITEKDYTMINTRIHGGKSKYEQIMFDFNPIGKTSWVYKRFFEKDISLSSQPVKKLHYTVLDNPWATEAEIARLKRSKLYDTNYYNIYYLGEWGELEGVIYNWDVVDELSDIQFDDIFHGGDFGFTVNPAAVIKIYKKANHYWLKELIYETGLTNQLLADKMKGKGVKKKDECFFDSAELKSIQELCDSGINALPAIKGADSVRAGIDYLKECKIHILSGSENIIREQKSYIWKKDKDGNSLNVPIEINDHAMDGTRYGIYTYNKRAFEEMGFWSA